MTRATAQTAPRPARTADGKPNFSGIWQANNEAHWDLRRTRRVRACVTQPGVYPYEYARVPAAPVLALGAAAGVPGSIGVVEGDGQIPYKPEAAAIKKGERRELDRSRPGAEVLPARAFPRAMYMPYPFQIVQSTNKIQMAYTFANAARTIHLDKVEGPPDDTYMGHSVGRWEGDTLVVDVTSFNGRNWFDRAGNFHSAALQLVERFTPITPDAIRYEVTIEDPEIFTRPWKIAMPLYRRLEPNAQLIEYPCIEFVGGVHVRARAQAAAGEAVGRRDDDHRYHAQGSVRRQILRVVSTVTACPPHAARCSRSEQEDECRCERKLAAAIAVVGLVAVGAAMSVSAHHAFAAEFDANKPVKFEGTVKRMQWINPHVWLHMEVKKPDGTLEDWAFEAGTPNVLFRRGFTKNSLLPGTRS